MTKKSTSNNNTITTTTTTTTKQCENLEEEDSDHNSSSSSSSSYASAVVMATVSSAEKHNVVDVVPYWAKIVSGSIGSILTAFAVTPLEVVKVRQQSSSAIYTPHPANVTLCPRGCGTFVFSNGIAEYLLPKNAVPYFDKTTGEYIPSTSEEAMKSKSKSTTSSSSSLSGRNSSFKTTNTNIKNNPTITTSSSTAANHNNLGTFQMIRRIFATEGLSGIYAGLGPTLVMGVPNTVLYFVTYEELASKLRIRIRQNNNNTSSSSLSSSSLYPALAGGTARFIASAFTAPLELIKTRQAARIGSDLQLNDRGIIVELTQIIRKEGFNALYKGLSPTLWRDVPFSAIYWLSIEQMREEWQRYHHYNNNNNNNSCAGGQYSSSIIISPIQQAYQALINGSISGMIAACCTTPLDVVKTRRQTDFIQINTAAVLEEAAVATAATTGSAAACTTICDHEGAVVYNPSPSTSTSSRTTTTTTSSNPRGTIHMMKDIVIEEGLAGLWKGNQARMFKVAPACAIMISSYEVGKRLLSEED